MEMLSRYTSSHSFFGPCLWGVLRRTWRCFSQLVIHDFFPPSLPPFLPSSLPPSLPTSIHPFSSRNLQFLSVSPNTFLSLHLRHLHLIPPLHLYATGAIRCLYDLISAAPTRKVLNTLWSLTPHLSCPISRPQNIPLILPPLPHRWCACR